MLAGELQTFPCALGGVVMVRNERKFAEEPPAIGAENGKVNVWGGPGADELVHCRDLFLSRFDFFGRELPPGIAVGRE